MTDKDVIVILKSQKPTMRKGAVERCIAALPAVKRSSNIMPLIRFQLFSLPPGMYGLGLLMIALQLRFVEVTDRPGDALVISGIAGALITLLLAWHLTLAAAEGMREIEGCCKFSYGQILLARVLCLCLLTTAALLAATVPGAVHYGLGAKFILLAILPTAFGALAAILWANWSSNRDQALMTVYLAASGVTGVTLKFMMDLTVFVVLALLLGVLIILLIQTKSLMNRRIEYEACYF